MSLEVPVAVRIGDRHVTREVSGLAFREEAVGGIQSISLQLARPLLRIGGDVSLLDQVTLYDSRTAETVAQGRISDTGRSASAGDGQTWAVTCFGPAQHASDSAYPYVVIDQRMDTWKRSTYSTKSAETGDDERGEADPSLMMRAPEGKTIEVGWTGDMVNRVLKQSGQKLARVRCDIDAGVAAANYKQRLVTRTNAGAETVAATANADTTAGTLAAVVVTDFTNGDNVVSVRAERVTSTVAGDKTHWFEFWGIIVRAMLKDQDGTDITTGYSLSSVKAHEVVKDILGRFLDQYDGSTATVDTAGAYTIDQLAYPDGVTPTQVLDDLMALEPAYRWTTGPDTTGNGYSFSWEPWSTTVRYEATLDDGGTFPITTEGLRTSVSVRYNDAHGKQRIYGPITGACPLLDAAGVTRHEVIDAADEIGSAANAAQVATNFLAEHATPPNSGTLNVARPIRDLWTGRMVRPHEVRAGYLVRVIGVEGYADALNASESDGQTVFRIWAKTYTSDGDTTQLELDSYSRTTANAIARLIKKRSRKR